MGCSTQTIFGDTFMKKMTTTNKLAIFAACALFLCGGFCLYLTAQTERTENASASNESASLLDRKLEECNERELLEMKVEYRQQMLNIVTNRHNAGSREGRGTRLAEARADLAAAEIQLYRHTGEQDKLLATHKARIAALTDKLQTLTNAYESAAVSLEDLFEAQIQLLDALLEQNREKTSPKLQVSADSVDYSLHVPTEIGSRQPEAERPIGTKEFNMRMVQADTMVTFSVTIHVTVLKSDMNKFDKLYQAYENRICDRVTTLLGASSVAELQEPGCPVIKAKIMKGINEVIETSLVRSVLFSVVLQIY